MNRKKEGYVYSSGSNLTGKSGYTQNGLPYNRSGHGPRPLVIFPGLSFENKPQFGMLFLYKFLEYRYTLYSVNRRPALPKGYGFTDMAHDYAEMIGQEFGQPVDIIGISTGGSIALHFAANYPELVRRLVIHSSAHSLSAVAKKLQLEVARLAEQGKWTRAWATLLGSMYPQEGIGRWLAQPLIWLSAVLLSLKPPRDSSDLVASVEAEDRHAFKERLGEIAAPTLIVAGMDDFFYTPQLLSETAEGIPNARLCLYPKMGHPAGGKRFRKDVVSFLIED